MDITSLPFDWNCHCFECNDIFFYPILYLQKQVTLIRSGFRNNDLAWPIHSLDQNSSKISSGSYQKKIEWNWWTIEFEFSSNKLTSRVDPKVFCNQTIYLNVKCFSYVLIGLRVCMYTRVWVCVYVYDNLRWQIEIK